MAWLYYDIKRHVPEPGLKPEFEHNYWETNLMCHLLHAHGSYREMYESPAFEALRAFAKRVDEIEDEVDNSDHLELARKTKDDVMAQFELMAGGFESQHRGVQMRDLYTQPGVVPAALLAPFHTIQDLLMQDTGNQTHPDDPAQPRFHMPCQMCLPFLAVQEKTVNPVPEEVMQRHIDVLGGYDLAGLYLKPRHELSRTEVAALREARDNGILLSSRGNGAKIIDFKNNLKCINGICQPYTGAFCAQGQGGACSGMSNP